MGKADYFKQGDWNCICDECGWKRKASECRKRWDGAFVCADTCWEPVHPQEYVKARHDKQRVPIARSDPASNLSTTAVKVAAVMGDATIEVDSISNMTKGDGIGITLDGGSGIHWTYHSDTPAGTTVYLAEPMPHSAAVDNVVYLCGTGDVTYLSDNEVTVASL